MILLGAVAGAMCAAGTLAQPGEYVLDDPGGTEGTWEQTNTPEPGSDAAIMAQIRALIAQGRSARARTLADRWIDRNARTANPFLAEAHLLRGEALYLMGREYTALFDLETVVRDFPASEAFVRANEIELEIGLAYLNGLRRKVFGFRLENAEPVGEELVIRVQERMPGSRLAERAAIELADHYYAKRELELASDMYAIFLTNYPESQHRERAALRQIYSNVASFKGPAYDASSLLEARILIEDFREQYPADAERAGITEGLLNRIDESAARQSLDTAKWYLKRGDGPAARLVLRRLLRRHPASSAAAEGLDIMLERGWIKEPAPPETSDGSDPDAASVPAGDTTNAAVTP